MHIPPQLWQERFILLSPTSKDPMPGRKWSDPQYQYTAEKMEELLNRFYPGCNYGVLPQGDLAVLDADNAERLEELGVLELLQPTFTVKSGRNASTGLHLYFRIRDAPAAAKLILTDPENNTDLGDIRLPGSRFYTVGPGSIHPVSRRAYTILADVPAASFSWHELEGILQPVKWSMKEPQKERIAARQTVKNSHWSDAYNLSVLDFLYPLKPHMRDGEIEGEHPVHGSTTGSNLSVKADGSVWYCRRCGSGGGWLEALAVAEGIINCNEAGDRAFTRDEWKEINTALKKLRPDVHRDLSWKGRTQAVHRAALEATYAKKS